MVAFSQEGAAVGNQSPKEDEAGRAAEFQRNLLWGENLKPLSFWSTKISTNRESPNSLSGFDIHTKSLVSAAGHWRGVLFELTANALSNFLGVVSIGNLHAMQTGLLVPGREIGPPWMGMQDMRIGNESY